MTGVLLGVSKVVKKTLIYQGKISFQLSNEDKVFLFTPYWLCFSATVTMRGLMSALRICMKPTVYPQTPDGGWGWVVAVAFFFVEVFSYGIIKTFGIFLQDLTHDFGETNSRVSWIISICVFVMSVTGETPLV